MKILNIAHGSFHAFGAYTAASAIGAYFAADLPGAAVGFLAERALPRPMRGRDEIVMILVTHAAFLVFEDVIKLLLPDEPFEGVAPALPSEPTMCIPPSWSAASKE